MSVTAGAALQVGEDPVHDLPRTTAFVGDDLYFVADRASNLGQELYVSDGGTATPVLLVSTSGAISKLTVLGDRLYFSVNSSFNGGGSDQLYVSDGTVVNTDPVKSFTSPIERIVAGNDELYISMENIGASDGGVWRSNGTSVGTSQVSTLDTNNLIVAPSGDAYFLNGGLWRIDGATGSTTKLKTVTTATFESTHLAAVGSTVYFIGQETGFAAGLYASNGTAAGTSLVRSFASPASLNSPYNLTSFGGAIYFTALESATGTELWRSDGTPSGTAIFKDLRPGANSSTPQSLLVVEGTLYFTAFGTGADGVTNTGRELHKTDGTAAGTVLVKDITPGTGSTTISEMTNVDGTLHFSAATADSGRELWRSDGTDPGTVQLNDLYPGTGGSVPRQIVSNAGQMYFMAVDPVQGSSLFRLNASAAPGTTPTLVMDARPDVLAPRLYPAVTDDGRLYFAAGDGSIAGRELFATDPNAIASASLVRDIFPGITNSDPQQMTALGNLVIFAADDASAGREAFRSDGTSAGTFILGNLRPGISDLSPFPFINFNGSVYFSGYDGTSSKIWRTDGTAAGTVVHANEGAYRFVIHNGQLKWSNGSTATEIASVAGGLYYSGAFDISRQNREPYLSTGDVTPALLLREIAAGNVGSQPLEFTGVGSRVFFSATDRITGRELWTTDGTTAGTRLVKDIRQPAVDPDLGGSAGPAGSRAGALVSFNGRLFFSADDGVNGRELWVSDGTDAGTKMLVDLLPGSGSSSAAPLMVFENRLYLIADDGISGQELWATDGTAGGTFRVADINPGAGSSNPGNFIVANGKLTFSANDGTTGVRLYQVDLPPAQLTPPAAPQITTVFVDGLGWSQNYRNTLASKGLGDATYGFAIDPADSLDELPWTNINHFSVRFSEDVNVTSASMALHGATIANRALGNFTYDSVTHTASWTLANATQFSAGIANEKLALDFTGVTGALSSVALGSGGTQRVRLNVSPGDVNRSGGSILGSDVTLVRNAQNLSPTAPGYSIFYDVNGSGGILGSDVTLVRNNQGRSLPANEPPPIVNFRSVLTRKRLNDVGIAR